MKSGKLITGLAVGAVVALIVLPKTRKMISDAVSRITDSFNDVADNIAEKGKKEINTIAEKSKEIAGAAKATRDAWQS